MKYIKNFKFLNESTIFLHFKEVLNTIEDLSLAFKDEGGEVIFGIMSNMHMSNLGVHDQNLDDISIKMSSIGKRSVYVKLDIQEIKKYSGIGKMSEDSLEILINTIYSINNYLINEDLIIKNFCTKELVYKTRSDLGKNEFFSYKKINELINSIDFVRRDKLGEIVGKAGIKLENNFIFKNLLDVRIVFSGQPI